MVLGWVWYSCTAKYTCFGEHCSFQIILAANILADYWQDNRDRRKDTLLLVLMRWAASVLAVNFANDHSTFNLKVFGVHFLYCLIVDILSLSNMFGAWVSVLNCFPRLQVFASCFMALLLLHCICSVQVFCLCDIQIIVFVCLLVGIINFGIIIPLFCRALCSGDLYPFFSLFPQTEFWQNCSLKGFFLGGGGWALLSLTCFAHRNELYHLSFLHVTVHWSSQKVIS